LRPRFDPRPVAERIWREVGYRPPHPRDLIRPMMETFDIAVILIPKLSIEAVNQWLTGHGRQPLRNHRDRGLRACLLARRGFGLIFIDGSMDHDERRYAVAHELAHFLAHYLELRRRAVARFGEQILSVLDGDRPATVAERLSEIIQHTSLGQFDDFLVRDDAGKPSAAVIDIENEADLVAMELLAPCAEVARLTRPGAARVEALQKEFGLPAWAAAEWNRFIDDLAPRSDPVVLGLERALKKKS
jgi:IrrE N-terminal-like domain